MPDNTEKPPPPPEPDGNGDTADDADSELGEEITDLDELEERVEKAEDQVEEEQIEEESSNDESEGIPLKVKFLAGNWARQPQLPEKQNPGDAGYDFYCVETENVNNRYVKCHTGLSIKVPEGFVGKLYARSSVYKRGMTLFNGVGIIDSGYTGEIMFIFAPIRDAYNPYSPGERIGQLILERNYDLDVEEVDELPDTVRSDNGFGSTGQ